MELDGMKIAVIVQARMTSERLPGKVMMKVRGKPLLQYLLERLKKVEGTDVVVATTTNETDRVIVELCSAVGVACFQGSERDVLSRYLDASKGYDIIVRVTGDCPLLDPQVVREGIETFLKRNDDYVSNTILRTFPRGQDVEVMSRELLKQLDHKAKSPSDREHVTLYLHSHPSEFAVSQFISPQGGSHIRLTVDTEEDFELIKRILEQSHGDAALSDILKILEENPEWLELNRHVKQKEPG